MYIDDKFLSITLNNYSRSLVGRLCKISETIQSSDSFKENKQLQNAISLLKSLQKELVYEEVRNLENQIKAFSEGKEYAKIYKPPTS